MIRVPWTLEEAVLLVDLYFRNGQQLCASENDLLRLSSILKRRAEILGIKVDEKYRNEAGISMQYGCVDYIVTAGKRGFPNGSAIFSEAYMLYKNNPNEFLNIRDEAYLKYGN